MSVEISRRLERIKWELSETSQLCDSASASNLLDKAEKMILEAIDLEANV